MVTRTADPNTSTTALALLAPSCHGVPLSTPASSPYLFTGSQNITRILETTGYWYKGELLPLPADLLRELQQAREQARQATERARLAEEQNERLRAQLRALGIEPEA
jgi:hypothetical protein